MKKRGPMDLARHGNSNLQEDHVPHMALPTRGRILLETTVGDIEIELWSKEAPKACRNVIALALEGYYDGVIFHRVVPGFLVQTGDRTGTGGGGESFFGEQFEDEIHPRLRFPHRGIVAMANNGAKNSNDSQFFITLDRAEELHGTHSVFGRTAGDSIYNVVKIGGCELGENERPLYPPRIKTVRILDNPFDDIVPRITAEEKRAQQRAREQAQKEREDASKKKSKHNPKLLSFGADEEGDGSSATIIKKSVVRRDLIENPETSSWLPPAPIETVRETPRKASGAPPPVPQHAPAASESKDSTVNEQKKRSSVKSVKSDVQRLEDEVRKLTRSRGEDSDSEDGRSSKKAKGPSLLLQELSKYQAGRGVTRKPGKRRDESDVMAALDSFRGKLMKTRPTSKEQNDVEATLVVEEPAAEEGMEVDDDVDWLSHSLHFAKDNEEEVQKAERDYEVIDPRARASKAKEEERQKKGRQGHRSGGLRPHHRR